MTQLVHQLIERQLDSRDRPNTQDQDPVGCHSNGLMAAFLRYLLVTSWVNASLVRDETTHRPSYAPSGVDQLFPNLHHGSCLSKSTELLLRQGCHLEVQELSPTLTLTSKSHKSTSIRMKGPKVDDYERVKQHDAHDNWNFSPGGMLEKQTPHARWSH